jgi:hypothetical protein
VEEDLRQSRHTSSFSLGVGYFLVWCIGAGGDGGEDDDDDNDGHYGHDHHRSPVLIFVCLCKDESIERPFNTTSQDNRILNTTNRPVAQVD